MFTLYSFMQGNTPGSSTFSAIFFTYTNILYTSSYSLSQACSKICKSGPVLTLLCESACLHVFLGTSFHAQLAH